MRYCVTRLYQNKGALLKRALQIIHTYLDLQMSQSMDFGR